MDTSCQGWQGWVGVMEPAPWGGQGQGSEQGAQPRGAGGVSQPITPHPTPGQHPGRGHCRRLCLQKQASRDAATTPASQDLFPDPTEKSWVMLGERRPSPIHLHGMDGAPPQGHPSQPQLPSSTPPPACKVCTASGSQAGNLLAFRTKPGDAPYSPLPKAVSFP